MTDVETMAQLDLVINIKLLWADKALHSGTLSLSKDFDRLRANGFYFMWPEQPFPAKRLNIQRLFLSMESQIYQALDVESTILQSNSFHRRSL
jgi:hypothetical protein